MAVTRHSKIVQAKLISVMSGYMVLIKQIQEMTLSSGRYCYMEHSYDDKGITVSQLSASLQSVATLDSVTTADTRVHSRSGRDSDDERLQWV